MTSPNKSDAPKPRGGVNEVDDHSRGSVIANVRHMARHRTLRVILPSDWREVPGRSPREYRRQAEGAGVLQVSLQPPQPQLSAKPETLLPWLQAFIRESMPELDAAVHEEEIECSAGPCAFSLRRSKQYGLVGLWVIPAEVFVFASYIMGSPNTVKEELDDAMTIIASAYFEDGDGRLTGAG